jgi:penicillin amidase
LFTKSGTPNTRYERLADVLSKRSSPFTVEAFKQLQHDTYSAVAARDLALFRGWTARTADQENARKLLADWDAAYRRESAAAALYSFVQRGLGPARQDSLRAARDSVVQRALAEGLAALIDSLGTDASQWRWGRINRSAFRHSLVRAYDLPPIERPGGAGTVGAIGATYRQIIDFADLDQSVATNVPGQSGQPESPFYGSLREMFARGEYFPLSYTRAAVDANTAHRLVLKPAR